MKIGVGVLWHVIVEDNVDSLDVHATTKEISCDQHALAEALERLILRQPRKERGNFSSSQVVFFFVRNILCMVCLLSQGPLGTLRSFRNIH